MKISIIIPVYNVQQYIEECLQSVLKQDIPSSDYEIILINDCSPDNSREIILNYKKKYSNIVFIEHETNKKQGGARNTGLKIATGEYILFLDSDDYLEENSLNKLITQLERKPSDLTFLSYHVQEKSGDYIVQDSCTPFSEYKTGISIIESETLFLFSPWSKVYKRDLLIKNNLFFAEGFQFEDVDFTVKAVLSAEQATFIPWDSYYYRYNIDSTVRCSYTLAKVIDGIELAYRIKNIAETYKDSNLFIHHKYMESAAWTLNNSVKTSLYLTAKERVALKEYIDRDLRLIQFSTLLNRYNKLFINNLKLLNSFISVLFPLYLKIKQR